MRRLDRVINEARMLRIARAGAAQAALSAGTGLAEDGVAWTAEVEAAERVLADLMERRLVSPDADGKVDRRRRGTIDLFDPTLLQPFIERCERAVQAVVAELRPQDRVFDALFPKVCEAVASKKPPRERAAGEKPVDGDRARRSAVADVAVLAAEAALLEVVRRVMRANDLARAVSPHDDGSTIVVRDATVRRIKPPKVSKGRLNAARSFGHRIPEVEAYQARLAAQRAEEEQAGAEKAEAGKAEAGKAGSGKVEAGKATSPDHRASEAEVSSLEATLVATAAGPSGEADASSAAGDPIALDPEGAAASP